MSWLTEDQTLPFIKYNPLLRKFVRIVLNIAGYLHAKTHIHMQNARIYTSHAWLQVGGRCEFDIIVTAYSDCGEELPLGPGFQELVNCYWRYEI